MKKKPQKLITLITGPTTDLNKLEGKNLAAIDKDWISLIKKVAL